MFSYFAFSNVGDLHNCTLRNQVEVGLPHFLTPIASTKTRLLSVKIHFLTNVLIYLVPFGFLILVFVSTTLLKDAKLQQFSFASFCQIYRVTEEA